MSTRGMSGGATTATPPTDSPPSATASMRRPCRPGEVAATAAVLVSLPGGTGRLMGDVSSGPIKPVQGSPADISGHLEAMAGAGATHLQLVVDPITMGSIEMLGDVLATLDRDREMPDAVIKPA